MFEGVLFLYKFCWKYNKNFVIGNIFLSIVNIIYPLISIVVPSLIINELLLYQRIEVLTQYIILLCGGNFLGSTISTALGGYLLNQKNVLFNEFQLYLSDNLLNADLEQLESADFLVKKEKAYKYLYGDGRGFASIFDDFTNIITQILSIVTLSYIIFQLNGVILIVLFISIFFTSMVDMKSQQVQFQINMEKVEVERQNKYYMNLMEDFTTNKEVKIYGLHNWIKDKYRTTLYELNKFYKKVSRLIVQNAILKNIALLIEQLILYFYLIAEIVQGTVLVGDFTMYVGAVTKISTAIKAVIQSYIRITKSENYFKEVEGFLNLPSHTSTGNIKLDSNVINKIEFVEVSFKYPHQSTYVLNKVSFVINGTEKLSIVGENGAGKTTLIKLLLRLYIPTEGKILINDIDINAINYNQYMKLFGVVFQDYKFFALSIGENVGFEKYDKDKVLDCLKKSGAYNKVSNLPNGLETNMYKIFDKEGIELSGGESQKLALAKALYKNAPVMILDEPTSSLDPRAEYELYRNFNNYVDDRVAIYISHRLSSCRFSDKIIVLKQGKVVEIGSHKELLENNGLYMELFNMQANAYIN